MLTSFFKPAEGKGKKSARPDDASTSDDVDEGSAKKLRTDDSATAATSVAPTAAVTPGSLGRSPQSQALFEELTDPEWRAALQRECGKPYVAKMAEQVAAEQAKQTVFPPRGQIFTAFNAVPLSKVRVVIIGQDPYHGPGQAHGLCFSVLRGVVTPPSLKNIYKELQTDVEGFEPPSHGNLQSWADQGVFMLNATMTVRKANANSHQKFGWQEFTDAVIKLINEETRRRMLIDQTRRLGSAGAAHLWPEAPSRWALRPLEETHGRVSLAVPPRRRSEAPLHNTGSTG